MKVDNNNLKLNETNSNKLNNPEEFNTTLEQQIIHHKILKANL